MKIAPIPPDEEERLKELYSYHIIDTEEEKVFDTIIKLAAAICDAPISSVTMLDRNRQWHKAFLGLPPEAKQAPREIAFCSYTILNDDFFEIEDAKNDDRFNDNPLVTSDPHIRFYGGYPLISPNGFKIGTLCVIDRKPKKLTDDQKLKLKQLSQIAMALMEAKKIMTEQLLKQESMTYELSSLNGELEQRLIEQNDNYSNLSTLSQMNGMLESCLEKEEAFAVIKHFCLQLFPKATGFIYLLEAHREYIELVSHWGSNSDIEEIYLPEDCWALRRGQIYLNEDKDTLLLCAHLRNHNAENSMCLPLNAQGESLGLLTLVFPVDDTSKPLSETQRLLCMAMGEQVALSIANINLRQSLRAKSTTDVLTGLYNRRYLFEIFKREVSQTLANKSQLALVMIDIDHFKKFNDTYGHDAGDEVLKFVGKFLKENIYDGFACRLGGEEFVIIFKNSHALNALTEVERIRNEISQSTITYQNKPLPNITISQGIAYFPSHARSLEELLLKADKALYEAKSNGRNCVIVYDEKLE